LRSRVDVTERFTSRHRTADLKPIHARASNCDVTSLSFLSGSNNVAVFIIDCDIMFAKSLTIKPRSESTNENQLTLE
jgi:hypothetical protein